jgi:gamma-glutamyltranspeptidase / glutathione hydrolase
MWRLADRTSTGAFGLRDPKRRRISARAANPRCQEIDEMAIRARSDIGVFVVCCLASSIAFTTTAGAASVDAVHGAVATEHRLASEAGIEMLRRGGNAVDAAVAAALATGVVNPSSSGLGGGGFVLFWNAKKHRAHAIDFRESAPSGASQDMYVRADGSLDADASKTGPLAVAVPGEPRGLELALKKFGRLRFADVAQPAIRIARDGFRVEAHLASMIAAGQKRLAADPALAGVFLHGDGSPYREGELLRRPLLAATLERLASAGVEDFYEGEIAADIEHALIAALHTPQRNPSPLQTRARPVTRKDLAAYRPIERDPMQIHYRGRDIWSMPPPSSGGPVLAEALAVFQGYDVGRLDPQGPTAAHLTAETLKAVFADRAVFYGDPAYTDIPLSRLLSRAHADSIRARFDWRAAQPASAYAPPAVSPNDAGTSHISVIDADGNAVALTTSVNTGFGSGIAVPGRDIVLNNTMDDFAAQPGKPNAFGLVGSNANAIAPGKRPLSSMTPAIVIENERVRLVAGASGGPLIITSTLETIVGVIDFGLPVDRAVAAPRIHHQWMPDVLMLEPGFPETTRRSLERVGHKVVPMPAKASVQAIEVTGTGASRALHATSDPRKGGVPAGY